MTKKLLRGNVILLLLLVSFLSVNAQSFSVSGKVTDESGAPMEGATVLEKGTKNSTLTKQGGLFQLNISSGKAKLIVSFVGHEVQEVSVDNHANLSVSLRNSNEALSDIVVIGYGAVKRADVTGAVAGINQQDIKSRPVTTALEAMQGKIAGVDITSNTRPGVLGDITIRGVRSLTASNTPLFVVDNIPLSTGTIDNIDPNDIESIDVLKDASATAIYGSRGANGVVIVTTKTGKNGKMVLSLNSSATFEKLHDGDVMMNSSQYIDFRRWAYYYSNPTSFPRGDQPTVANDKFIFLASADPAAWSNIAKGWASGKWDGSKVATTNWRGMVTQTGVTNTQFLSVSGGNDKVKAYGSFGYLNNKGTSLGQSFTRYSGRSSVDIAATKWFSMGSNINVSYNIQEYGQSATSSSAVSATQSIYESARALFPYAVPFDSSGNRVLYPGGDAAFKTIVNELNYTKDERTNLRAFGSFYGQVDLGAAIPALKGLKYRMNFGPDFSLYKNGVFVDGQSVIGAGINRASLAKGQAFSYTLDNLVYYNKTVKEHSFGITLLESYTKFSTDTSSIAALGIPFSSQLWNSLTQTNISPSNLTSYSSNLIQYQLLSYMARLNYGYADKYLLTVSVRQDGSSVLGTGHKNATFPSAAVAWRMNRERFLENASWVSDLKLRLGVGVTGNSAIAPYSTQGAVTPLFYPFLNSTTSGSLPSGTLANQSLAWERTTQYNVGIDFSILNRRITGVFDVYTSKTPNLLLQRSIPTVTGFNNIYANIGATANKGFDFSLYTINVKTRDLMWSTTTNISFQKEHIVSLSNGKQNDINNLWFIGQPIGVIYGYKSAGIWHYSDSATYKQFNANGNVFSPGNVRPVDLNGDHKVDPNNDRKIIGNTRPNYIVGMTNTFSYKGIELSVFLYGRLKYWYSTGGESEGARGTQRLINYYTENNQNSAFQKPIYTAGSGDPYSVILGYQRASFIKVRNISLSYNMNPATLKKTGVSSLRLYAQATNPGMLFSKINYIDMDVVNSTTNPTGIANRGVTFGINAAF
ncbi:SusC/RagA family TonB-linked outer membrane protein [Puia sp.]|jgi:TonB-linked SusC/RagA family outer membrane protein|uniref:SusC/RagA family TonB-linked outer membrane protein n=1 Tax=Puia sp. TaxID=2045100 RepID=UPI002F414053